METRGANRLGPQVGPSRGTVVRNRTPTTGPGTYHRAGGAWGESGRRT